MADHVTEHQVTLYLRDYLVPGNLYPYESLFHKMEEYHLAGKKVSVISVPGFLMATNHQDTKRPWSDLNGGSYKTAKDCIRLKNAKRIY